MIELGEESWGELATAVESGVLYLKPGAAARCAQHCREFEAVLKDIQKSVRYMSKVSGMGTFPSGIALAEKFGLKASGGAYSMDQALADHIAEVQRMQQVFEKIEAMYGAAEESAVQGIVSAGAGF
ncbi:hypothetical protein [Rhodococcus sp. NPDC003348]